MPINAWDSLGCGWDGSTATALRRRASAVILGGNLGAVTFIISHHTKPWRSKQTNQGRKN
jgi:hypothetical protein